MATLIAVIAKEGPGPKGCTVAVHKADCRHQNLGELWCQPSEWPSPDVLGEYAVGILSGLTDDGIDNGCWKYHISPCAKAVSA